VKILNPVPLFNCAVNFFFSIKLANSVDVSRYVLQAFSIGVFEWYNGLKRQFYNQMNLVFEVVTGTWAVSSKESSVSFFDLKGETRTIELRKRFFWKKSKIHLLTPRFTSNWLKKIFFKSLP
jgi:hypothetical protein